MKRIINAILLSGAIITGTTCSANAQMSPNWDMKSREQARANTSAAITLLDGGQVTKAVDDLRRAIGQDSTDAQPFLILGLALGRQGQYAEALDALQKAYSLQPSNEILLSTGLIYYLQHDYDAAINAWNKMLQSNPNLCNVYADIGMALLRKGNLLEASDAFQRVVHCSPNSDLGYYGLSLTNYLSGNFRAAQEQGERALSLRNYPTTVLLLAKLDMVQGDRSRGKRRTQQFTSMMQHHYQNRPMTELGFPSQHDFHWDPLNINGEWFDNGYLLQARYENDPHHRHYIAELGHAKRALDGARKQISRAPGDLLLTHELALVEMGDGDFSSSAEHLQAVVQQCPQCSAALLDLGRALALDGKTDRAAEQIQEFKRRLPKQEISSVFTEPGLIDPGLRLNGDAEKRLPKLERVGPNPLPSSQF
jgi:tetratricopeptide (TPR) repeat protein